MSVSVNDLFSAYWCL